MEKIEKLFFRGIFGVVALFAAYIFLFFYNIDIPINWITITLSFLFGWPAIILIVVITLM